MEMSLWNLRLADIINDIYYALGAIISIGIQDLASDKVIFQESFQILLSALAEEERVDPGSELLKCQI